MRSPSPLAVSALLSTLAACGGGGGGGTSTAAPPDNTAPILQAPAALSGGPTRFSFVLPMAGSQALTFTAVDGDGDPLLWQVGAPAGAAAATGLVFDSPVRGATFALALQAVTAPAAATINILVEDPRGAAASIDLQVVRSGAPTIASVTPDSAFVSAPQQVHVHGEAFSLGSSVQTQVRFAGLSATDITALDENTLRCSTPATAVLGPNTVSVENQFGSSALPATAFTTYAYPVDFVDTDTPLDGGAGNFLAVANDGPRVHTVWIEGGGVVHRVSTDAGATFSAGQLLTGAQVSSQPQVAVVGEHVTVAWVGGSSIRTRSSSNGGATFGAETILGNGTTIIDLRLVASGVHRYCAWMSHSFPSMPQRVHMSSSRDGGSTWSPAGSMQSGSDNQIFHTLGCDGEVAWLVAVDAAAALPGLYASRTADGGVTWSAGQHVGPASVDIWSPCTCNDGARVYVAWMRGGALEYVVSTDRGAAWPNQATELRPASLGLASSPSIGCVGERLSAVYQVGANTIGHTRVGSAGAFPQHTLLSTVLAPVGVPQLGVAGNYVFATWRSGDVTNGNARVRFVSSVDRGLTFTAPAGLGDGNAAQDAPRLLVDGARLWLGWRDSRGATPALFCNRTEQ